MKKLLGALTATCVSLACAAAAGAQDTGGLAAPLATQSNPMTVVLDARKAPIGLAYSHMTIPVSPGTFTIDYPQWIPGDHGPTGPLNDISELRIAAGNKALPWERDQVDPYEFRVNVPQGVATIDVTFTVLLNGPDETMATRNIMVGNWNRYLFYQRNIDNEQYYVKASMIMPDGWDYASALPLPALPLPAASPAGTVQLKLPPATGAGAGELVYWCKGKEASFPFLPTQVPTDATVVGIVDKITLRRGHKNE